MFIKNVETDLDEKLLKTEFSTATAVFIRAYETGRLEDSGRQNGEKMSRETVHSQSYAKFFRHSAVLSLPAFPLRKLASN